MQAYSTRARTRTRHQMSVQFGNLGAVVLCAMAQWLNVCALPIILNLSTWQLCAMTRRCMQCMHVHMCKLQRPSKPSIRHLATSPCIGMYHTCIWLDRFRCAPCAWFSFCVLLLQNSSKSSCNVSSRWYFYVFPSRCAMAPSNVYCN